MKVAVLLPSHGPAFRKHERCLSKLQRDKPDWQYIELPNMPVLDIARARLTSEALRTDNPDVLLWIDADMTFEVGACEAIVATALARQAVVGCIYAQKKFGGQPQVKFAPGVDVVRYYGRGGLYEADWVGFGLTAVPVSIVRAMISADTQKKTFLGVPVSPLYTTPSDSEWMMVDDEAFCSRVRALGYHVYVDTVHRLGHLGEHEFVLEDMAFVPPRAPPGAVLEIRVQQPDLPKN